MSRMKLLAALLSVAAVSSAAEPARPTYCNPINLDYGYTPLAHAYGLGHHRATADPVMLMYRGDYYLFSTNQGGYWWSENLQDWHFVKHSFLTEETQKGMCSVRPIRPIFRFG